MSEYKENTVGWWLSQLKEPLKSRALAIGERITTDGLNEAAESMPAALTLLSVCMYRIFGDKDHFWIGVFSFFNPVIHKNFQGMALTSPEWGGGMYMAEKCAPDNWLKPKDGGEDKAIVDPPKKTTELFFYADETLINPLCNPFKEPLVIYPRGEMNSVIVEEDKIKELMNANPSVTFWPTNVGGVSPAPEIPVTGAMIEDFGKRVKWPITREIEAPERAVVGYEEPKPIDTIEKKHELRIKNLELEIKRQADDIEFLKSSLDFVITRVGNLSKNG